MGRQAHCYCRWADQSADCNVLLEAGELILRGPIRRRVPLPALTRMAVRSGQLTFRVGEDDVALALGTSLAEKWAVAIATPPPTLAKKLGISSATELLLVGTPDCRELESALAEAASCDSRAPHLILACVHTSGELQAALTRCARLTCPLWIVYPKGSGHPIDEMTVRTTLRERGFIDTKVASVSAVLTALRFIRSH